MRILKTIRHSLDVSTWQIALIASVRHLTEGSHLPIPKKGQAPDCAQCMLHLDWHKMTVVFKSRGVFQRLWWASLIRSWIATRVEAFNWRIAPKWAPCRYRASCVSSLTLSLPPVREYPCDSGRNGVSGLSKSDIQLLLRYAHS